MTCSHRNHGSSGQSDHTPAGPRPSRLYRNTEKGVIFGVCAGLADYFGISRFIVRIVAVIALFMFTAPVVFCYFMAPQQISPAPR